MSAYIVSDETISVLVKGFELYGINYDAENYHAPVQIIVNRDELRKGVGQSLLDQNYASVNCRYNEENKAPEFVYTDIDINPGMVYGCIRCYEYQASETNDYFNSGIHHSLVALKNAMLVKYIRNDNYKIPWGYGEFDIGD